MRFTAGVDGTVYAIVRGAIAGEALVLTDLPLTPTEVRLLGEVDPLVFSKPGADLLIQLPGSIADQPAHVFALR